MEANNFYYWGEPVYCSNCGGTNVAQAQWTAVNAHDYQGDVPSSIHELLPEEGWCLECRSFSFLRNLEDLIEHREEMVVDGEDLHPLPNLPEGVVVSA